MEQICYRCNAPIAQGKVFCPQCGAPQIRVTIPEAPPQVQPDGNTTEDGGHFSRDLSQRVVSSTTTKSSQAIDWSHGLPSIAVGGMVGATLMIFPPSAFGPAMLVTGATATYFYYRRSPASALTPGIGAKLGAFSGILGFVIFAVFAAITTMISGTERLHEIVLESLRQSAARTADPQALSFLEFLKTPTGLAILLAAGMLFLLFMFLALATAGGALSAAWIRRRRRPF